MTNELNTVLISLGDYDYLRDNMKRGIELEAETKRLSELLEIASECNRAKLRKIKELEADAELGRLVRAMPEGYGVIRGTNCDGRKVWQSGIGYKTFIKDTPEEALRAAGVGETSESVTEWHQMAANAVYGRVEHCPATIDHVCPKADNCPDGCVLNTAVQS